jgi:PadR family transcriptional regulator, regulatory protein PadR
MMTADASGGGHTVEAERELLKGNTPTLVLAVLKDAPLHGYGIAREIERRSGNALRCKEGTLYPTLHALERDGLIVGQWSQEHGGRERKVYEITPAGLAALERRRRTWTEFATAIYQVIGGAPDAGTTQIPERQRRRPIHPTADPEPIG